jgi:hypothetical protein
LKKINKGITVQDTIDLAMACERKGIVCFLSFIIGIPSETEDEMLDTFQLIDKIHRLAPSHKVIGPQIFRPYPGSTLFREAASGGLREPASLAEWTNTDLLSTFKVVEPSVVPWIPHAEKFKYLMASYNVQSKECSRSELVRLAASDLSRFRFYQRLPRFFRSGIKRSFTFFVEMIVSLQVLRIRNRFYRLFYEKKILVWLERKYF